MKKKLFYEFDVNIFKFNNLNKIIFQIISLYLLLYIIIYKKNINKKLIKNFQVNEYNKNLLNNQIKIDYENNKFVIIREKCKSCGLFMFHNRYLGCIVYFIKEGYIPIVDLISFPNIFNRFNINSLNKNPWELYFN